MSKDFFDDNVGTLDNLWLDLERMKDFLPDFVFMETVFTFIVFVFDDFVFLLFGFMEDDEDCSSGGSNPIWSVTISSSSES